MPVREASAAAPTTRRGRGRPTAEARAATAAAEVAAGDYSEPANINDLLDLTLRAILQRHQSLQGFGDWLDRRKKIAEIDKAEFNTARARGAYISRAFVEQHLFGVIESTNLRLLSDMPLTATSRLFSLAKSGASLEEGRRALTDIVSQNLSHVKRKAISLLRSAKSEAVAEAPRRAKEKRKEPR